MDVPPCDDRDRVMVVAPDEIERRIENEPASWDWPYFCPRCAEVRRHAEGEREEFEQLRRGRPAAPSAAIYGND